MRTASNHNLKFFSAQQLTGDSVSTKPFIQLEIDNCHRFIDWTVMKIQNKLCALHFNSLQRGIHLWSESVIPHLLILIAVIASDCILLLSDSFTSFDWIFNHSRWALLPARSGVLEVVYATITRVILPNNIFNLEFEALLWSRREL